MWPHELSLGPFSFGPYGLAVALGALAGLAALRFAAPWAGATYRDALDLSFWLIVAGLLGARAAYVVSHWDRFSGREIDVLRYWRGGLTFHGGLVASMSLALFLAARGQIRFFVYADAILPCLALGQAVGRVGCFLVGCCHGLPAPPSFPLRQVFPYGSRAPPLVPLYPTQLMESLGLFIAAFAALWALWLRRLPRGAVASLCLVLTGALRFYVDFYRGDYRGPNLLGLPPTTWAAAGICLFGLVLAARLFWLKPSAKLGGPVS